MKDFKPMLAHVYTDENQIDWSQPVYMQPKLDGVRCVFTKDGAFSRTGKRFMNVRHIEMELQELFKQHPHLILDGELYNHKLKNDFEKIISLVRKQKPTDTDRLDAQHLVQFHVYDYTGQKPNLLENLKYKGRQDNLTCSDIYCPSICYTDTKRVATPAMIKVLHDKWLDMGYEGSIIRLNGEYEQKRSKNLLKVKDFSDSEAKITGFVEGKGKRRGTIGKFIAVDSQGMQFGMPVMDKFKYLQDNFKEMQTWICKIATFTYFEKTIIGSYRHPLFKAIRDYE